MRFNPKIYVCIFIYIYIYIYVFFREREVCACQYGPFVCKHDHEWDPTHCFQSVCDLVLHPCIDGFLTMSPSILVQAAQNTDAEGAGTDICSGSQRKKNYPFDPLHRPHDRDDKATRVRQASTQQHFCQTPHPQQDYPLTENKDAQTVTPPYYPHPTQSQATTPSFGLAV